MGVMIRSELGSLMTHLLNFVQWMSIAQLAYTAVDGKHSGPVGQALDAGLHQLPILLDQFRRLLL